MATPAERRALLLAEDPDFNPLLIVDVNEYLIENFPQLNLKQRRAVWTKCQYDEEFDYELFTIKSIRAGLCTVS